MNNIVGVAQLTLEDNSSSNKELILFTKDEKPKLLMTRLNDNPYRSAWDGIKEISRSSAYRGFKLWFIYE